MKSFTMKSSRMMTKVAAVVVALAMVVTSLAVTPANAGAAKKVKVSKVKITNVKETKTLTVGKSFKLKYSVKVKPNKKANKKVTFKSSKKSVATVSSKGVIKAKKAGKAKITVTSKKNKKKKATITVVVKAKKVVVKPTTKPTTAPTAKPTVAPTAEPTVAPTAEPTVAPTVEPTVAPTVEPTVAPTAEPTVAPTEKPYEAKTAGFGLKAVKVNSFDVVLEDEATEADVKDLTITMTPAEGTAVTAKFKALAADKKTVTFEFDEATAEGAYVVSSDKITGFEAKDSVTYDKTAPAVKSVTFTDYKTLKVEFTEAVAEPEKPNIATAIAFLDSTGKAVEGVVPSYDITAPNVLTLTKADGFAQNTAAADVYSYAIAAGTFTDLAGNVNAVVEKTNFNKEKSYPADFTFTNDGLPASTAKDAKINFTAVDQYGAAIVTTVNADGDYSATASVGSYPLTAAVSNAGKITVTKDPALAKGATMSVTLNLAVSATVSTTKTAEFTFRDEATEGKITAFSSLKANKTGLKANSGDFDITPAFIDEFNYTVALSGDTDVKYVIENTAVVTFKDETAAVKNKEFDGGVGKFTVVGPGSTKVTAFLISNSTITKEIPLTVDANDLTSLVVDESAAATNKYNNEDVVVAKITGTAGAVLTPDMLKAYVVTTDDKTKETTDCTVSFAYGTTNDTKNNIYATIKSTKAGKYTVLAYKGTTKATMAETLAEANKAVQAAGIDVVTTLNPNATSMTVADFTANELTVGKTVEKEIKFFNKYNEQIDVQKQYLEITSSPSDITVAVDATDATTPVKKVKFTGVTAGKTDVRLKVTNATADKSLNVETVAAATLKSATLEKSAVEVIAGDAAVKIPVTFKDQYGNAYAAKANELTLAFSATVPKYTVKLVKADGSTEATDTDAVAFVSIETKGDTAAGVAETISLKDKASTPNVLATVTATAKAARVLTTLTATPATGYATLNTDVTFTVSGKDQYGDAVVLEKTNLDGKAITGLTYGEVAEKAVTEPAVRTDLTMTVKSSTAGTFAPEFVYTDGALVKSATASLTVASAGVMVKKIELTPETYTKKLTFNDDTIYTVKFKAYDASNNEVAVQATDIVWGTSNTLKLADGQTTGITVANANNVITVTAPEEDAITGEVTVTAQCGATQATPVAYKFSNAASVAAESTFYLADTATTTADKAVTEIKGLSSSRELYLVGTDQYGDPLEQAVTAVTTDDTTIATVVKNTNGKFTITNVATKGTTNLRVYYAGGKSLVYAVAVGAPVVIDLSAAPLIKKYETVALIDFSSKLPAGFNPTDYTKVEVTYVLCSDDDGAIEIHDTNNVYGLGKMSVGDGSKDNQNDGYGDGFAKQYNLGAAANAQGIETMSFDISGIKSTDKVTHIGSQLQTAHSTTIKSLKITSIKFCS